MTQMESSSREDEEFWRDFLAGGPSRERVGRRFLELIPRCPRCRLCAEAFALHVGPPAP